MNESRKVSRIGPEEWVAAGKPMGRCAECNSMIALSSHDLKKSKSLWACGKSCLRELKRKEQKTKTCYTCKSHLTRKKFRENEDGSLSNSCISCAKEKEQRRRKSELLYGVTRGAIEKTRMEQNDKCAICGDENRMPNERLAIDHCHKTGKFRALLCRSCNTGIGIMKENKTALAGAIRYLEKFDHQK